MTPPASRPPPPPPRRDRHPRGRDEFDDDFDPYGDIFEEEEEISNIAKVRSIATPLRAGIVGGLLVTLLLWAGVSRQFDPAGNPGGEVVVQIPDGTTTSGIATLLQTKQVVPNALAFKAWVKFKKGNAFQAGEYTFHLNSSAGQALAVLQSGPDTSVDRITIPEGYRLKQISETVGRLPGMSAEKFLEIADSGEVRSSFEPSGTKNLEGFLFPDTYLISSSDDEKTVLQRMVNQFDTVARTTGLAQSARAIQHSPYDTLIIASMIESEAKVQGDRAKISQVIENRLAQNMPLQIDATVLYALHNDRQVLSSKDLKINDPSNTYLNKGLPPAPISNPGRASITAALQPETGSWLYYVVADASGAHAFATTGEEHEKNVEAARKKGLLG